MRNRYLSWSLIGMLLLFSFLGGGILSLFVDYYWFSTLSYQRLFLTVLGARVAVGVVGVVVTMLFLAFNWLRAIKHCKGLERLLPTELAATPLALLFHPTRMRRIVWLASLVLGLLVGLVLASQWERTLLFFTQAPFGVVDPIFGQDTAFYVFTLPFIEQIRSLGWTLTILALLVCGVIYLLHGQLDHPIKDPLQIVRGGWSKLFSSAALRHMGLLIGLLLFLFAVGAYLDRFERLYDPSGLFTGPGYADIYGTLPSLALRAAAALVAMVAVPVALMRRNPRLLGGVFSLLVLVWVGGNLYSGLLQRIIVAPNELEKERPFLARHIAATNRAFKLDLIVERTLDRDTPLTAEDITRNRSTVNNVRLWDHEPLLDTFSQIQEIRTYYDFVSVDNDRYHIDGELRQTMLSPREMNPKALPSPTWINQRLTFTHGYGVTAGPVNRVNEQGLPVLFVQDLPPKTSKAAFHIDAPEIYYGEVVQDGDYVFVNTAQEEFDYPQGDTNVFTRYEGSGGISLASFWRRLLFSAHLRDLKLLLSQDFGSATRLMIHRNVVDRVRRIAPFFFYDSDPYMIVAGGRLIWVLDAYTRTARYPYAEQVREIGNYMRNPVKVLVDAKNGSVHFYAVDPEEPLARAYGKIFPGLLRPMAEMPEEVRAHLRHPADLFYIQAALHATYHMRDVNTFYNKEDQWSVPVVGQKQMEPYYTIMRLPGESQEEFILMLPFTPRRKDNLAAWMAARSDGEHYGQLIVYTFPKQKLVYGPKQMVARINQHPEVSQQITLWDQSGSNVIRGTLLVIPIEDALIYIQPLYLRAEDGRIPELKRVIAGYENEIAMGLDLEDALDQIFSGSRSSRANLSLQGTALPGVNFSGRGPSNSIPADQNTLQAQALREYRALSEAGRTGSWDRFGQSLQELGRLLEQLHKDVAP